MKWYLPLLISCVFFMLFLYLLHNHLKANADHHIKNFSFHLNTYLVHLDQSVDSSFKTRDDFLMTEIPSKAQNIAIGKKKSGELDFKNITNLPSQEVKTKLLPRIHDHTRLSRDFNGVFIADQLDQGNHITFAKQVEHQGDIYIALISYDLKQFVEKWHRDATDGFMTTQIKNAKTGKTLMNYSLSELFGERFSFLKEKTQKELSYKNAVLQIEQVQYPSAQACLLLLSSILCLAIGGGLSFMCFVRNIRAREHDKKVALEQKTYQTLQAELKKLDGDYIALRKDAREYRHVLDSISDIIFEVDAQGNILFMNEAWERVTHISSLDILNHSFVSLFHENDQKSVQQLVDNYLEDKHDGSYLEARLKLEDNACKMVRLSLNMMKIPENKDIFLVGSMMDIDHRVRSEEALRSAESKYRSMVEKSLGGIYRASPGGVFIEINPALATILGYEDVEECLSKIIEKDHVLYCDEQARYGYLENMSMSGLKDVESRVYKKDGSVIWISESIRPIYDVDNNIEYYEGTIVDISKRKVIESALLKAKTHSDLANRAKSEFLANMSHELRTPLNAIIGFSEILKAELFGPLGQAEYKEYSEDIYNSGTHLLEIINDILDMSKIESGKRELSEEIVSLYELSLVTFKMVKPKADLKQIKLENLVSEDVQLILGEQLAIKQILINLLNNAVKFSHEGGCVTLSTQIAGSGEFVFSVSDTGIGMRAEDVDKALSAFGQIDGDLSKNESGTGLGLTLVEQLAKLHGGRIEIDTKVDEGTTVHVILPGERIQER